MTSNTSAIASIVCEHILTQLNGVSLIGECDEFRESDKSLKHELSSLLRSSPLCLAITVVASWSLAQEVAGSVPFND